jgi:hypothetical protein
VFQVRATSPQAEEFVAASFGDGKNFMKQLEDFAVSKGMSKPAYSVVPRVAAGKLSYSCFLTVSTDFEKQGLKSFILRQPRLKREALAYTRNSFCENCQEVPYLTCSFLYKHV